MKQLFVISLLFIMSTLTAQERENVFTCTVGKWEVTLLSDGQQVGRAGILVGATPEMSRVIPDGTFPNAINAFLVKAEGRLILIDTGLGKQLFAHLQALGVSPEQVDVVLLTHMHGDHIGGMFRDGAKAFSNAEVYLARPERDYWARQGGNAARVIEAYEEQLHLFQPGELGGTIAPLFPGVKGIAAFGHTPGHCAYLLESGGERLLVWGDLTHAMAIQMPYPRVSVTYDVDPDRAVLSREAILAFVVRERIPVAGMHIAFPAIGRVEVASPGYRFIPAGEVAGEE
ncbi:MAG: MBL fold metallo-hydrolase [Odoribacteraceae bacterium]|jgi:glyoxylase-like metal-dependent hydrolase (beta-lactamase superfamily II)|nr:MBL fold metallo-hydrolase [Odoribacteraceae bacterium]